MDFISKHTVGMCGVGKHMALTKERESWHSLDFDYLKIPHMCGHVKERMLLFYGQKLWMT
jgi:hypothetical protein